MDVDFTVALEYIKARYLKRNITTLSELFDDNATITLRSSNSESLTKEKYLDKVVNQDFDNIISLNIEQLSFEYVKSNRRDIEICFNMKSLQTRRGYGFIENPGIYSYYMDEMEVITISADTGKITEIVHTHTKTVFPFAFPV